MLVHLPKNFKLPLILQPYDGTTDLQEHVTLFTSMMLLNNATNLILCQAFHNFLQRAALLWFLFCFFFFALFPRLIYDFTKLSKTSLDNFSSNQVCQKDLATLAHVKQAPNEPTNNYLTCVNVEAMQIRKINPNVALYFTVTMLKAFLVIKPTNDLEDFRT